MCGRLSWTEIGLLSRHHSRSDGTTQSLIKMLFVTFNIDEIPFYNVWASELDRDWTFIQTSLQKLWNDTVDGQKEFSKQLESAKEEFTEEEDNLKALEGVATSGLDRALEFRYLKVQIFKLPLHKLQ